MKVILELSCTSSPPKHILDPPERRHAEPECEAEAAAKRDSAQCDSAECGGFGAPGAIVAGKNDMCAGDGGKKYLLEV